MTSKRITRYPPDYYKNPENSIGYLTRIVFRNFSRLLERHTLQHDISAGQWRFLRQLWIEDGITQRELSERVGMREPTTVVALKGLEAAKLIRREKSEIDRRKIHIYLTPFAKSLEAKLAEMDRQKKAGEFVISAYQEQLKNARAAEAEKSQQTEAEIKAYENRLADTGRACLLDGHDLDFLRQ